MITEAQRYYRVIHFVFIMDTGGRRIETSFTSRDVNNNTLQKYNWETEHSCTTVACHFLSSIPIDQLLRSHFFISQTSTRLQFKLIMQIKVVEITNKKTWISAQEGLFWIELVLISKLMSESLVNNKQFTSASSWVWCCWCVHIYACGSW